MHNIRKGKHLPSSEQLIAFVSVPQDGSTYVLLQQRQRRSVLTVSHIGRLTYILYQMKHLG